MSDATYEASQSLAVDPPWSRMEPICVGRSLSDSRDPAVYIKVERDGHPFARIDVFESQQNPFAALARWGRFIVLGGSDVVLLVDPETRTWESIGLDGYFGYIYPCGDRLLIAGASELVCLNRQGMLLWRCAHLGIDGVIVEDVIDEIIRGRGEWDPPGGWDPFRVSLATGERLD